MPNLSTPLENLLNLLLPRKCAGCGKSSEIFCRNCLRNSYQKGAGCVLCNQRNGTGRLCPAHKEKNLKKVFWAGLYRNELKKAVWQLKYGKRKELARPIGSLLAEKFRECYPEFDSENFVAVPIPVNYSKQKERGFNQAELLAEEFSRLTDIRLLRNCLLKIKDTTAQVKTENKLDRLRNLEEAFSIKNNSFDSSNLKGETSPNNPVIILIDDVSTTGATLRHASRALEKAGAKKIIGLVAAH